MRSTSLALASLACIVPAFRINAEASNRLGALAELLLAFSNPSGGHSGLRTVRSAPSARRSATALASIDSAWVLPDNPVWVREGRLKTVGDAKDAFYKAYGKPLKELVANFVRDTLTAVTLAQLREGFCYSRLFALGLDSLCTSFLQEVPSESDREAVRTSLCVALDLDPGKVKCDAEELESFAKGKTEKELLSSEEFKQIAAQKNTPAKYTYALGSGLLNLMPLVGEEVGDYTIERWCEKLNLKDKKLKKDWELYQNSLDKLNEAKAVLIEMSAQKKRQEAAKLKEEAERAAKEAEEAEAAVKAKEP